MRILLQPAYILHHRPYRETSILLELLSKEYGRISAIAKGARAPRSAWRPLLQPFIPLLLSWQGKGELMTLTSAEINGRVGSLQGDSLLSGFYLNELLMKVLQKHDPQPQLYTIYHNTLLELQGTLQQKTLRLFEKKLLEELGYGFQLHSDFSIDTFYQFYPEHGFKQCEADSDGFRGKSLLAFANETLDDEESLKDSKRLMRMMIATILGVQPLNSRKLFNKNPFQQVDEVKDNGEK